MALGKPVADPVSQTFGGTFYLEPLSWFVRAASGRLLKAFATHFPGSVSQEHFHRGIDVYGALGTPLLAMEAGTVVFAGNDGVGGRFLRVRIQGHTNVYYSFDHCSAFLVGVGAVVKRGQVVAKMGNSGNAKGVHVHVEVEIVEKHSDGITRRMHYNPLLFLPANSYRWGAPYGTGYLPGGDLAGDDRIYPIHSVSIGAGVNVRVSPDVAAPVLETTTAPLTVPQLNLVEGGSYTIGGVPGTSWAKVSVGGKVAYVASPLVHPV